MEIFEEKEKVIEELNAEIQPSNNQRKRLEKKLKDIEATTEYKGEYSVYNSFKDVSKNLKKLQNERDSLETFITTDLNEKMDYLTKNGFFENNEITLKGKTALLFRELDNVIGAELVFSVFVDTLDERKYLSLLTLISEGRNAETFEIPESYIEIYHFVDEMFPEIIPNREYVFPVLDWYDGSPISNIINNYKIFEGDLIKTINKINNYIDELNEGYILKNNLKFVEMLNSIKNRLQREIVSTESLYLRL
jgi:superfamily II RNA helicase